MAQTNAPAWSEFPPLPDSQGFAGMYAGVSGGALLTFGGANFPGKPPWEGGKKKWYDHIYVYEEGKSWRLLHQKLPVAAGYGVAVSYQDQVILVGGSSPERHLASVLTYRWEKGELRQGSLPALPHPLANMAGTMLGDYLLIFGGMEQPAGAALKTTLLLDLKATENGWKTLAPWDGPERIFPVCGLFDDKVVVMGGETTGQNAFGKPVRRILQDAFALQIRKRGAEYIPTWQPLAPVPRGVSAAGTVLPLLQNGRFLVWGGVDAVTAAYGNPATHPGIVQSVLYYDPYSDTWEYIGEQRSFPSRVTLPVVRWKNTWLYVSGEIKPGIRTPSVIQVH